MITSLLTSLIRVTVTWYLIGILFLFFGDTSWAESAYRRLSMIPGVPVFKMMGLETAMKVQLHLLMYWTLPMLGLWVTAIVAGVAVAKLSVLHKVQVVSQNLTPVGEFWGVTVGSYSLGKLPQATVPTLTGLPVSFSTGGLLSRRTDTAVVEVRGAVKEAVLLLSPAEKSLAQELLQLLSAQPDHFAGLGHGVGLLEHTLNVLSEVAPRCTAEFRLPFIAALAHDVGKLLTFKPDGKGGWVRKGLHSREGARILATLPAFRELPQVHQNALLLAVKYDHAPSKIPFLRGEKEDSMLALRIINALSAADKSATSAEKDRNLEKLQPEDILWQDFVTYLRDAPVVQKSGKKGVANQVNNPPDNPYLYIYESVWREEAIKRLPAEVAAALDLSRRDKGKVAKYTRILAEKLKKEGLLVVAHTVSRKVGDEVETETLQVSEANPLWDIQSGQGEKAVSLRGILVLHADLLWKTLNYRLGQTSPYSVQMVAPNADAAGKVNPAPAKNLELPNAPDTSTGLAVGDLADPASLAAIGLGDGSATTAAPRRKMQSAPSEQQPQPTVGIDSGGLSEVKASGPVRRISRVDAVASHLKANQAPPPVARSTPPKVDLPAAALPEPVAVAVQTSAPTAEPREAQATPMPDQPVSAPVPQLEPAPAPVEAPVAPVSSPAPATAPSPQQPTAPPATEPAARSPERQQVLAVADEQACQSYAHLAIGDLYYVRDTQKHKNGDKHTPKPKGAPKPTEPATADASPPQAPTQETSASNPEVAPAQEQASPLKEPTPAEAARVPASGTVAARRRKFS